MNALLTIHQIIDSAVSALVIILAAIWLTVRYLPRPHIAAASAQESVSPTATRKR